METVTFNLSTGRARREIVNGESYLVAPMTIIVSGVLPGSDGPLYYPPEETAKDLGVWNGTPIVVYHPFKNGKNVSASEPGVFETQGVGFLRNDRYRNGKRQADGWFHVEDTRRVDPRVLEALEEGRPIELSTGLFVDKEPATNGATDPKGRPYHAIARNYKPDHLAVLPDQVGACSIQDGCGVLVNAADGGWTPVDSVGFAENAFCPTGDGGGQDNSCSSVGGEGRGSLKTVAVDMTKKAAAASKSAGGSAASSAAGVLKNIEKVLSGGKSISSRGHELLATAHESIAKTHFSSMEKHQNSPVYGEDRQSGQSVSEAHEEAAYAHQNAAKAHRAASKVKSTENSWTTVSNEPSDERDKPTGNEWTTVGNAFCPTGEGGGQDNSCSSSEGGSGGPSPKLTITAGKLLKQALADGGGKISLTSAIGRRPHTGGRVQALETRKKDAADQLVKDGLLEKVSHDVDEEVGRGLRIQYATGTYRLTDKGRKAAADLDKGTRGTSNRWTPVFNEPSDELDMDPGKACEILRDGTVHGKELTESQRGMFGALCGQRDKPTKNAWRPVRRSLPRRARRVLATNACCSGCEHGTGCEGTCSDKPAANEGTSLPKDSWVIPRSVEDEPKKRKKQPVAAEEEDWFPVA